MTKWYNATPHHKAIMLLQTENLPIVYFLKIGLLNAWKYLVDTNYVLALKGLTAYTGYFKLSIKVTTSLIIWALSRIGNEKWKSLLLLLFFMNFFYKEKWPQSYWATKRTYTYMTSRITFSKRSSSENVLRERSTSNRRYCMYRMGR